MKVKKIKLENIRSYRFQEIDFPEGSVLLWGNIGSGKSSVLLGVDFALFGLQKGNLAGASLLRNGEERGSIELHFSVEDKDYVIKRGLKRSKTGVTQDFGFIIKDGIKEEKTTLELKQKILEILDYPKNLLTKNKALIFRYTVYTPQEEMKLILTGSKEERLDALRKVFGIDKYKRIKENCKVITSDIKSRKKLKEGFVSDLDSKLVERLDKEEELRTEESKVLGLKIGFEEQKQKIEQKKEELKLLEEKKELLVKLKNDLEINKLNLEHKKKEIEDNEIKINEFSQQSQPEMNSVFDSNVIGELEKTRLELEKELRLILDKIQDFKTKKSLATALKDKVSGLNNCPTCLQQVREEHKSRIISEESNRLEVIENALNNFSGKNKEVEIKITEVKSKIDEGRKEEGDYKLQKLKFDQFKEKEGEILKLKNKNLEGRDNLLAIESKVNEMIKKIEELSFVGDAYNRLKGEFDLLDHEFRKKELEKKELEVKVRMVKERIESLGLEIKKKEEGKAKLDYLNKVQFWLESHFVKLMENMEKNVMFKVHEDFNSLFEKWFSILVENENLQMTLDEEFSPRIFQNGYDTEYDYLSGGEKTAGALAYRLALNQVINNIMSSIKTKDLLILDEPTDGFSSEQLDRMRLLMEEINIGQIIIVSHEAKVESFVDNIIRFEKIDHSTNVVT
ncbi:AAA family ATPase [archaeon]|jgi:DNA repair protein SbcC/Rad50|nr:AAA family ATPase [archaeon]MBT4397037.1 AAA family ATPase [archaeon]MBT4441028.1 AAA family ATPase [archaeon]